MSDVLIGERSVVFNGAMATGKTTQAKMLAKATGAALIEGDESKQPEIASGEIYTQGSSVDVEKWFLNFHLGRLASVGPITTNGLVSDMSLQNDLVWGRALLKGRDLEEFEAHYKLKTEGAPVPDTSFLFLLPTSELIRRVRQRAVEEGRNFEANTSESFIEAIQNSFIANRDALAETVHVIDLRDTPTLPRSSVHELVVSRL